MSQRYPVTPAGLETLKVQLHEMKTKQRPAVIKLIEEAREHGDISENAEYDAAKDKQGILEARIADIENRVADAQVIDPAQIDEDKVVFGATVTLMDLDTDQERMYQIVGDHEADLKKKRVSINSPIARALIGKKEGEIVEFETPGGLRELEIIKIEYK
ncbi:MAG: transcription elongation factor GreA [Candidatus Lernaella stagnicola]|nr:transcription elongation factor GreA [Candidatus Lernaella stagnicola]